MRERWGGGGVEQSNSCWASHLLQVESSANRQTGTDPLRQAPGRVRDGQKRVEARGGGKAKQREDGMRWIQLKRWRVDEKMKRQQQCSEAGRAPATCYCFPKWRWQRKPGGAGWWLVLQGKGNSNKFCCFLLPLPLHPSTSSLHLSFLPSFWSVRQREQEKPVRVKMKGLWGRCVRGRWMNDLSYPRYPTGAVLLWHNSKILYM